MPKVPTSYLLNEKKPFIEMAIPEKGEIFTHKDDDGTVRNFAIALMREFIKKHAHESDLVIKKTIPIEEGNVDHIRKCMGIEQERLDRLGHPYLGEPILGIVWDMADRSGTFTVVDGNHRIVKMWGLGYRTIEAWLFHPLLWKQFLLNIPREIAIERLTAPSRVIEFEQGKL